MEAERWVKVRQEFGDPENGVRPTLFIHSRCRRLIETLPTLQHDPNRPEDVLKVDADEDGNGGDDCADALRYLTDLIRRSPYSRRMRVSSHSAVSRSGMQTSECGLSVVTN